MKAQVLVSQGVYYKPGARIDMSTVTAGQKVFIYSTFNDGTNNYSRFIVNSNNSATVAAADVTPANFVTNGVSNIWEVQSVADETSNGVTAKKITLVRNMGVTANKYLGIGGASSNGSVGDAQTFYVTSWSDDVYKSGTTKVSGTKFYVDATGESGESWSDTQTDNVYMVTAGNSKCFRTSGGSYNTSSTEAYPIIFYTVESATTPEGARDLKISDAPSGGQWAANTTWYKIKIDGTSNRYWSVDKNYTDVNGYLKLSNTTEPTNLAGLWCVVGDVVNGYKFYNAAKGTNYVLSTTGSGGGASTKMVATSSVGSLVTNFDICTTQYSSATTTSWAVKDKDSDYNYLNYREPYLAHWNSDGAFHSSNGKGSMIDFIEVSAEDVASYVDAEKTSVLSRFEAWTHVPALWPTASEVYNTLNTAVTAESATDATKLAAIQTAGEAFVAALNGVRFTAQNRGNGDRSSRFLSIGSSSCVGVIPDYSMDEVLTIKPNTDGSFKIYGENSGKYISSSASAVDLASAEDFYLQTSASDVTAVENVGGFHLTSHATNLLHLNNFQNEGTTENPMTVYGFGDAASRWLLSTDVSRHELQTAINNATTFKTNLETLMNKLLTAGKINVKFGTLSVTLPAAITKAQNAFDDAGGTPATRTAAAAALNAALTKAKGAWLGELGTTQQFRLKSHSITTTETPAEGDPVTTNYYLTMAQTKNGDNEGNAILAAYNETDVNQIFTLVPGTGANAGKYILVSKSKQLKDLGFWNTDMADAGTPYGFEDVDVANSLFRVRTTQGLLGPNDGVTGADLTGKNKFLYTNHSGTRDNLTWELEFIAPTPGALNKTSLQATFNAQTWYPKNSLNIVATNAPSVATYYAKRDEADKVLKGNTGSTVTQLVVNTAEAELKAAYEQMLNNFISEADPTQSYRLVYYHPTSYTAKDLYMTLNPAAVENNAVNVMQVKTRDASTLQTIQFRNGVDANQFYIIEGINKKELTESTNGSPDIYTWNPALVESGAGKLYTFERVTLDGVDELIVRIETGRGTLGPNSTTPTDGTYVFNDKGADNYWIIKPCVSPEIVNYLKTMIDRAKRYEGHIGTGIGEYTTKGNLPNDALVYNNNYYTEMITETGDFENNPPSNVGITAIINDFYNTLVFPITINKPTPGKLYRFKGKSTGKYMCAATANAQMSMVESLDNPGVIFQLKAGETIDGEPGYKFLSYNTGYYTKETYNNGALAAAANSIRIYESESGQKGFYTMKSNYSGDKYISDNGNVVDRNSSYAADRCDWTIEEVTWLPVPINTTVGFGTLYSPVALKGVDTDYAQDERLEFYYGVKEENVGGNDKLVLTKLTGDIPAEIGFIVKYKGGVNETTGCVYMKIADSAPALSGRNELTGTLETVAKPTTGTVYTLQNKNNTLGFYKYTGANVNGGKAYYLWAEGSAVSMGFVFDFEGQTTGVESIEVNADNQVIYDLSGRRVAKAGKGLYIINGKKVLVK